MINIFAYDFIRRAFIIGILISVITPCIGSFIVLRRLSMIGDALSHSSLAGVAVGLACGFNPVAGAVASSITAAILIEGLRKKFRGYSELSIAVVMSTCIAVASIFSSFSKSPANFNSFLFGSIVAVTDLEFFSVILLSFIVIVVFLLFYNELIHISFDESSAKLAGISVGKINFMFVLLTAISVSVAARIVGALIVSSLMVIPVAASMQIAKSFKQTIVFSVIIAIASTVLGLFTSYYADLKPGGTIVLFNIAALVGIIFFKQRFRKG